MGWIIVMFDLPVVEPEERRQASDFRKALLDNGYLMLQESVYARNAVSREKLEQYINRLHLIAPDSGKINAFFLTNKQWTDSVQITTTPYRPKSRREVQAKSKQPDQLTFW